MTETIAARRQWRTQNGDSNSTGSTASVASAL